VERIRSPGDIGENVADDRTGQDVARPGSRAVERSSDVEQRQISNEARLIRGVFRAAGVAAGTVMRGSQWAVGTTYEVTREITQAALDGESSAEIAERTGNALRSIARSALGVTEGSVREIVSYVPTSNGPASSQQALTVGPYLRSASTEELRRRGDALLARSADVYFTEDVHPAYDRILDELAPDEARILRLLLLSGPQPSVDVRTGGPLGMISSQLIAPGLNMIGARAGCRYVERVPQYLNNLFRLGMIWFSSETLRDPLPYQVVEAQPEVLAAMKSVRFAKIIRRSIHLTPFGEDFCRVALNLGPSVDLTLLPEHGDAMDRLATPDSRPRVE